MLIPLTLLLLGLGAALAAPRSRVSYYVLVGVLTTLMGGNLENPDREPYIENYAGLASGQGDPNFEAGYQALVWVFTTLGAPFELFHLCAVLTGLMLISSTVTRFSRRPALVFAMYAAYPMFWDYVQVRNFLAMALLIYAAQFIIGQKKSVLRYVLGVAIASSLHISSLIFLIMPLACVRHPRTFYLIAGTAVCAYMLILELLIANPIFAFLVHKIETYTVTETSDTTKAAVLGVYLASCTLVWWCSRLIRRDNETTATTVGALRGHTSVDRLDTTVVLRMFLLSIIFLPLATINLDFMRLYRNMFVLSCLVFDAALLATRRSVKSIVLRASVGFYLAACFFGLTWLLSLSDIVAPLFRASFLSVS